MKIVPRSEWGAVYGTGDKGLARPARRVVIHHTYRPDLVHGLSLESVAIHVRAIEEYHVRTKGWSGIGYNWLIDQDGRVYEGRGWGRHGAHAAGVNSVSIGIAFMVDGSARTPTESAWRSAEWLIRYGVRAGEIAPGYTLTGHRDHGDTDCPGDMIYEAMDRLRDLSPDPVPEIAVPDRGPGTDDTLRLDKVDVPAPESEEEALAIEILFELQRARAKFPGGDNVTMLALMEEVGELAKATFEESRERVRKEAIQVATMAMRVVLDGDQSLDEWRRNKGLDPLTEEVADG